MENIGRKRKVSGTILAGAFTVPTVMSAVQQNVVSANLYGANMPKGLTTAVSKSYAKGVSTKYLTKFLRFTTYVLLPTAIAVLTVISLYQFGKYLTRYNYWKVLSRDENPGYSEAQKCLFSVLSSYGELLGIENTELEVDTGVLLGILDLDKNRKNEIEDLCKNKERVKISISEIDYDGRLGLIIEETSNVSTKYFDNNDSKIIKFLNKILEQSNKKNKNNVEFVLERQGGNFFLKATKNKEKKVKVNMNDDFDREVRKIKKLLEDPVIVDDNVGEEDGNFGIWEALKEKEAPDYYTALDELFNFMEIYGEGLGIEGKKVEVKPKVLLDALDNEVIFDDVKKGEMVNFLKDQQERPVAVYIEMVDSRGRLGITIENKYKAITKYFANDIPRVIKFFNKILAQSGGENKDNLELEWDKKGKNILLKQKNTNNKVNVGDYDTADFEDNMKKLLEGQGDLDNEEFNYWKILKHKNAPANTPKDQEDLFSFLCDYSEELKLEEEIKVDPGVLLKVLRERDGDVKNLVEVRKFLKEKRVKNEKVTVSIAKVEKGGYLTLELKNEKMDSPYVINTKFFDNDITGIIKFFNKIFEQTSKNDVKLVLEEEKKEGILMKATSKTTGEVYHSLNIGKYKENDEENDEENDKENDEENDKENDEENDKENDEENDEEIEKFKNLLEKGPDAAANEGDEGNLNNDEKNGQYSYWEVLYENNVLYEDELDEEKRKAFDAKLLNLFFGLNLISQIIGAINIKVDSGVLLNVIDDTEEYLSMNEPLLKKEKEVTVKFNGMEGYRVNLMIKGEEGKEEYIKTHNFNYDVPGIINFFNKIFEQSKNKIKLKLEEDKKRENVVLKATESGKEVSVVFGSKDMKEDIKKKMEVIRQLPNSPYLKNVNGRENVADEGFDQHQIINEQN